MPFENETVTLIGWDAEVLGLRLSQGELNEISHFMFLWSYFEWSFCETHFRLVNLRRVADKLISEDVIDIELLSDCLTYAKRRYVDGEQFNHRYEALNIQEGNESRLLKLMQSVLINDTGELIDKTMAYLVIVFRLRNNLFHGTKWEYCLEGQLENFQYANAFLSHCVSMRESSR